MAIITLYKLTCQSCDYELKGETRQNHKGEKRCPKCKNYDFDLGAAYLYNTDKQMDVPDGEYE
jgi:predicted Zn-ribbon and HTH transcriptional regulator